MPPKTFTCVFCKQEVSRRNSLSLLELNGQSGRACRDHQEVQDLLREQAKKEAEKTKWQQASRNIFIIMTVAQIRVAHTLYGTPLEIFYLKLQVSKVPREVIEEIKSQVNERGPKISAEEIAVSVSSFGQLAKRTS